jgi:putative endonuclease
MAKKHVPPYFVYILRCVDNSLYTGITTDVARRFSEHVAGTGAAYTRAHRPVAVVYTEGVEGRSAAQKREAAIKKLTKVEKEALCAG